MITKDGRDTPIEKLTPDNYVVPKGEEKDYHAIIEVVQYDPKTGRKISRPRVQKFGRKAFEQTVQASLTKGKGRQGQGRTGRRQGQGRPRTFRCGRCRRRCQGPCRTRRRRQGPTGTGTGRTGQETGPRQERNNRLTI